jgi:excisionase family DNA binding protein
MPRLMSRHEAAEYLGVKPQTLAIWATTKRYNLPYIKVGRLAKYRQEDLDEFITNCTRSGCGGDSGHAKEMKIAH